jgi:hypothetical protein
LHIRLLPLRERRIEFQRRLEVAGGLSSSPQRIQNLSEKKMRARIIRVNTQRLADCRFGILPIVRPEIKPAKILPPSGFSTDRLLVLDTVAKHPQPPALWDQVTEHLRGMRLLGSYLRDATCEQVSGDFTFLSSPFNRPISAHQLKSNMQVKLQ